jgi:hypothetical protein
MCEWTGGPAARCGGASLRRWREVRRGCRGWLLVVTAAAAAAAAAVCSWWWWRRWCAGGSVWWFGSGALAGLSRGVLAVDDHGVILAQVPAGRYPQCDSTHGVMLAFPLFVCRHACGCTKDAHKYRRTVPIPTETVRQLASSLVPFLGRGCCEPRLGPNATAQERRSSGTLAATCMVLYEQS